ncbi:unnamed protein product [Sympodiomycopsis kandeliae]
MTPRDGHVTTFATATRLQESSKVFKVSACNRRRCAERPSFDLRPVYTACKGCRFKSYGGADGDDDDDDDDDSDTSAVHQLLQEGARYANEQDDNSDSSTIHHLLQEGARWRARYAGVTIVGTPADRLESDVKSSFMALSTRYHRFNKLLPGVQWKTYELTSQSIPVQAGPSSMQSFMDHNDVLLVVESCL